MLGLSFCAVRCFRKPQECAIRPITVLVGENSTGKSTFLALARIAWDIAQADFAGDPFNEEPFLFGAYDQIASYGGGRAGRAKEFVIGARYALRVSSRRSEMVGDHCLITATFAPSRGQPKIERWCFQSGKFRLDISDIDKKGGPHIVATTHRGSAAIKPRFISRRQPTLSRVLRELSMAIVRPREDVRDLLGEQGGNLHEIVSGQEVEALRFLYMDLERSMGRRPYAFAPIRTRPQRTYDPAKDVPRPEGSHVPMFLANTYASNKEDWLRLRNAIDAFGEASGLFKNVEVQRKGSKESDPFQIVVRFTGPAFNLVDVGYGVSQILPIVVDALRSERGSTFLLQQPEVHLHPRAQAELASFLLSLAKTQGKQFLIETHSDYLVDRIRLDVRDKRNIAPEDVVIHYFERRRAGVEVRSMLVDQQGNLIDAPASYRSFFLDEEKRMLGL